MSFDKQYPNRKDWRKRYKHRCNCERCVKSRMRVHKYCGPVTVKECLTYLDSQRIFETSGMPSVPPASAEKNFPEKT